MLYRLLSEWNTLASMSSCLAGQVTFRNDLAWAQSGDTIARHQKKRAITSGGGQSSLSRARGMPQHTSTSRCRCPLPELFDRARGL